MSLVSVLAVIISISLLVIIHELGHFSAAKFFGILVNEFGFGMPPRIFGKKIGETLVSFNWFPIGGFVRIYGMGGEKNVFPGRGFKDKPIWQRMVVTAMGIVINFVLGWFLVSLVLGMGVPQSLMVADLKSGSVASLAGIQKGDLLTDFKSIDDLNKYLNANKGKEINLNIDRGGGKILVKAVLKENPVKEEGNLGVFLGEVGTEKKPFPINFWEGLKVSFSVSKNIFLGFFDIIVGVFTDFSFLDKIIGPVGIASVAVQTAKLGTVYLLQILAMASLNLAVFNFFPLPALDGGRLLFLLIEKIKGSAVKPKIEMVINAAGFLFLVGLSLVVTAKDILNLIK